MTDSPDPPTTDEAIEADFERLIRQAFYECRMMGHEHEGHCGEGLARAEIALGFRRD